MHPQVRTIPLVEFALPMGAVTSKSGEFQRLNLMSPAKPLRFFHMLPVSPINGESLF